MLNKRFKIAKCKTSLKLATSRIKLMRNKKGVQINQMKKELAQLLESGQDRTARIRVEHVIREEKMIAAYDLIEIYCELIVARLPIIESQKTCPIDLKEAVTSVIFAAPRCSDIPELLDARKNFTAKYGKEFVSAAIELRPDCGVSRMLVEKLSAVAPDVQTKVKVLSGVAKEYSINWEPTSFEEKELKPPQDLLNGPTNFEYPSTINVDSPKIQSSNIHNYPNVSPDFQQQNKRFTLDAQSISVKDNGSNQTSFSSTTSLSGMSSGMMNTRQSFNSNQTDSWNMEFKDATSAAQAAAESAERASMAARAAAQLSRQYSTESHVKPPELTGQLNDRNPKKQNQQMGPTEIGNDDNNYNDNDNSPKSNRRLSSLRSRNDQNHYSRETSLGKESRSRFQSGGNQSSFSSSRSDDALTFDQQIASQTTVVDQESRFDETSKTSSYSNARRDDVLTFDQRKFGQTTSVDQETDSDDDNDDDGPRFDMGFEYDEQEAKSFFPSPGRESIRPLENPHVSSPKNDPTNKTDHTNRAKPVDHLVKTGLSDGPDAESESEMVKSRKSRIELNDLIEKRSSSFHNREKDDKTKIRQSQKSSRVTQSVSDNNDLEDENGLKFPTLSGGLRNKGGLKYPLSTKSAVTDGSTSFKKPVNEIPVKVDPTSKPSRLHNKKPIVSSSESDSDDDTFSVHSSKTRSQFAPPDLFYKNDETDPEEEVVPIRKQTSASKLYSGSGSSSGLSRRTKGQVEPRGKKVISDQSPPKPRPHVTPSKQEPSRTFPDPKISEQQASPRKTIVESGKPESSNLGPETSPEANNVKKPSHVHPKLPEYDSLAARIQALQSSRK